MDRARHGAGSVRLRGQDCSNGALSPFHTNAAIPRWRDRGYSLKVRADVLPHLVVPVGPFVSALRVQDKGRHERKARISGPLSDCQVYFGTGSDPKLA